MGSEESPYLLEKSNIIVEILHFPTVPFPSLVQNEIVDLNRYDNF